MFHKIMLLILNLILIFCLFFQNYQPQPPPPAVVIETPTEISEAIRMLDER